MATTPASTAKTRTARTAPTRAAEPTTTDHPGVSPHMATSAYEAVAATRPRIRRDVLFTETPQGVLFH
ncbi:MAG: hypothetical protein ACRDOV_13885, partial [Streptomyces sp.]